MKIVLTDLVDLQNENTAVTAINNNNAILESALDNTLSRDGSQPNVMTASFDMNSNHILNLPAPSTTLEPVRLQDFNNFIAAQGTTAVNGLPTGGTTGQALIKNSGVNYDVSWASRKPVSVLDYGASPTASAAVNTAAIQSALDNNHCVYIPTGVYSISAAININVGNTTFVGDGPGLSVLTSSSTNLPMISIAANLTNITVDSIGLTRSVTAISGAVGIKCLGYLDTSVINNCEIQKQNVGILLSSTGYSSLSNCFIHDNLTDGAQLTNTASNGTLQWYINNTLIQGNDLRGIVVIAATGPAQVTLGDWVGLRTFANSSFGAAFAGLAGTPISGIRLKNCFFGGDGNSELFLDTFGGQHQIQTSFIELAGTGSTGSNIFHTPASGVGNGIEITSHNIDIFIVGTTIVGNSNSGINTQATTITNIQSSVIINNFQYGAIISDGTKAFFNSNYLSNNASGPIFVSANSTLLTATGNMPKTINTNPYIGTGAPAFAAAQGSTYIRSDGSSSSTRMYINTNGSTGWTAVTTVA